MSSSPALPRLIQVSPLLLGDIVALIHEFADAQGCFASNLVQSVQARVSVTEVARLRPLRFVLPKPLPQSVYAVAVTPDFSVLLQADCDQDQCQLHLNFEPSAIMQFLATLAAAPPISEVPPNSPQRQTEFTHHLMHCLLDAKPASTVPPVSVQKLIEQSALLHQVTKAIGQSLDLNDILETAVDRVRQFLQVDRLLIHQFDIPAPICLCEPDANDIEPTPVDRVTYESCARDDIPSVLNQMGDHWMKASQQLRQKYQSGLVISTTHIDGIPDLAEVLQFPAIAQIKSELTTPILVQGNLWGLLIAHQCDYERQWEQADQSFLQQIVDHLSIAIYQAQLFAKLQEQTVTLEQKVAARTQELRDALMAAQAADVAKSEFLATMSHELRTPLTCVIGMSATLMRYAADDGLSVQRRQSHLQIIHDRGEALLTLINDILDLANIEAGRTSLTIRSFSLTQLVQQTLRELEDDARAQQISLSLDVLPNLLDNDTFNADPQRVRQILLNLLSNAVKFTPTGGSVILRVRRMPQGVMFQVQDTGIGIAPEQQPLIFQKFQQLDSSYQRHYEGTGLGLALTKQLVELHGGKIEFVSQVNVGSTFTVTLPQPAIDALPPVDKQATITGYLRVLLVEAIEEQATLVCNLLTAADCQVIAIADLEMALSQIEVTQPNIVIVNCRQFESAATIADFRQALKACPAKCLAVVPEGQSPEDYADIGADDYLTQMLAQPELLVDKVMQLSAAAAVTTTKNKND